MTRTRPEFVSGIFDDLAWLGLSWEAPVLRQSEQFPVYAAAADRLRAMGVLYRCFATRTEIAAAARSDAVDPDGAPLYPGLHRTMSEVEQRTRLERGEPCAWRLNMPAALDLARRKLGGCALTFVEAGLDADGGAAHRTVVARPERWGDTVIVRKETPTSYHLSVVVDDARQGVTHVTRGMDLYAATDLHRLLQVLLDLPEPRYCHHRLLLGPDGRKLAKSERAPALAALRLAGEDGPSLARRLGFNLSV